MITVRELIEKLRQFDPDLPVAVADWSEGYMSPSSREAAVVKEKDGFYWNGMPGEFSREPTKGKYVQIGDDD